MAITSYPFDNQDTTESQYSKLFRELQDSGVVDSQGGTAFQPFADATGMTVKLRAGMAIVRGHVINSDAVFTVTLPVADSQARVDRIVLRLDPTANSITPTYIKGTAGAGVAPAMTQTDTDVYDLPIATVNVAGSAPNVGPNDVTDVRAFVGSRIGSWTTSTRPPAPRTNQLGYNSTTGLWETWSGAAWGAPVNELTSPISTTRKLSVAWGASATAPTVGIRVGDTWFDTQSNAMRTYDGTTWRFYGDTVVCASTAVRDGLTGKYENLTCFIPGVGTMQWNAALGWSTIQQWIADMSNPGFAMGVTGTPTALPGTTLNINVPPGRQCEVELVVPEVTLGAGASMIVQGVVSESTTTGGNGGSFVVDSARLNGGSGGVWLPMRLRNVFTNTRTGYTWINTYFQAWSNGAVSINADGASAGGAVVLRHRFI